MKIYVVLWNDRHFDASVEVFSNKDDAISYAKKNVKLAAGKRSIDETLTESMKQLNWIYYGCYSCEGDNITVMEKNLNEKEI